MLVTEMTSGLIVGGEYDLYTGKEFAGIMLSCLICIAGILVLVLKKSQLNLLSSPADTNSETDEAEQSPLMVDADESAENRLNTVKARLIEIFTVTKDESNTNTLATLTSKHSDDQE